MSVVTVWDDALPIGQEWTVDDLARLPDDGRQYELFDGVLVVSPSPFAPHQRAVRAIYRLLDNACPTELEVFFAPFDFQPTDKRSLQPDVMVVRRADVEDHAPLHKPLLLAVEVLSNSTAAKDQIFKRELYAKSLVAHFWIFDPRGEPTFTAHDLVDGAYKETHHVKGDAVAEVALPYLVRICPAEVVAG
jgi:Uma2 family endonuclease